MKKILDGLIRLAVLPAAALLFLSCTMSTPGQGQLVIRNEGSGYTVLSVWCRNADDADAAGWTKIWSGTAGEGEKAWADLPEGKYDVKIEVLKICPEFVYTTYETGYKDPVSVCGQEYSFVTFDGRGVYKGT